MPLHFLNKGFHFIALNLALLDEHFRPKKFAAIFRQRKILGAGVANCLHTKSTECVNHMAFLRCDGVG